MRRRIRTPSQNQNARATDARQKRAKRMVTSNKVQEEHDLNDLGLDIPVHATPDRDQAHTHINDRDTSNTNLVRGEIVLNRQNKHNIARIYTIDEFR